MFIIGLDDDLLLFHMNPLVGVKVHDEGRHWVFDGCKHVGITLALFGEFVGGWVHVVY